MVLMEDQLRNTGGCFSKGEIYNLKNLKQNKEKTTIGRRIIDIESFGNAFDSGCGSCGDGIKWKNLTEEKTFGLCSGLHFKCEKCPEITRIYTSPSTTLQHKKRQPFSVNVKAALAMIHAGIGATHLNSILGTLGLPSISPRILKKNERGVGTALEKMAQRSCSTFSDLEKSLTVNAVTEAGDNLDNSITVTFEQALQFLEADRDEEADTSVSTKDTEIAVDAQTDSGQPGQHIHIEEDEDGHVAGSLTTPASSKIEQEPRPDDADIHGGERIDITVSQDAAWSKRGKAMNSLSGVGHAIGQKTGKCLNFSTRKKKCKRCSHYKRQNLPVPDHDCRMNWNHSAKSMEADIAVQLHKEAANNNIKYAKVIGDEDSSAIKQIRENVNSDVEKFSDLTHIKRSMTTKLLEMNKSHSDLTEKVRSSFVKNFSYAVHQNKHKGIDELKTALQSIVPHMYGDHGLCGDWCSNKLKSKYHHNNLPYGKDLTNPLLQVSLQSVIEPFVKDPTKLMTSGDSQANEALNNVIFSKAPKFRNYNLSESFDFRCAAGVLQFNDGNTYIHTVFKESNLSPRKETMEHTKREDRKRKYGKDYKLKRAQKRRRIELKNVRKQRELVSNIKLGTRYERDCCDNIDNLDTREILDPPKREKLDLDPEEIQIIFIDLETTKLGHNAEIIQIGACIDQTDKFSIYMVPHGEISDPASRITGLRVKAENGERILYKNETKVHAVSQKEGVDQFIQWLCNVKVDGRKQVLCAHNGHRFDFPILIRNFERLDLLGRLRECVYGVVDSIAVLKTMCPKRESYALNNIYKELCAESFDHHDALNDVVALNTIFKKIQVHGQNLLHHAVHIDSSIRCTRNAAQKRLFINTLKSELKPETNTCVISDRIAGKMYDGRVDLEALMLAHKRDPENGIKAVLSEKIEGKIRVTNRNSIIDTLKRACAKLQGDK